MQRSSKALGAVVLAADQDHGLRGVGRAVRGEFWQGAAPLSPDQRSGYRHRRYAQHSQAANQAQPPQPFAGVEHVDEL